MNGTVVSYVMGTEYEQGIHIQRILWNFIFSPLGFHEWGFTILATYANTDKISGFFFGQETEIWVMESKIYWSTRNF